MKSQKRKKIIALLLALAIIVTMIPMAVFAGEATNIEWYNFRNNPENNGVVNRATPIEADTAGLKWAGRYGTGFWVSPTPPLILDGYLYVGVQNKVYKIDKNTGDKVAESDEMVASVGFAMNPITYADGKLFVQVGNGVIQALDYETLQCVWYTEKIGGQTVSPIAHTKIDGKGYLYLGTWSNSSSDGALICVSTDDSNVDENKVKKSEWRFVPSGDESSLKNLVYDDTAFTYDEDIKKAVADKTAGKRGFYWAGAYACDRYVAIGSDDGSDDYGEPQESACFYTIDPKTGEIIDKIAGIKGDIRTTVVYDEGFLYFCTKGGLVYKVSVGQDGNLGQAEALDMGGEITASPVVYNGRLYVGVRGQGGQFDPDGGHAFAVVDTDTMKKLYDLPISGYPQASALLSTAYENEDFDGDGEADGRVYIYFTYNAKPGGIYYTYDAKDQKNIAAESGELYVPEADKQNYCISTICTDNDGVLYYKNDSGYIMAVENKIAYASEIGVSGALSWSRPFEPTVTEYEVVVAAGTKSANLKISLPLGVTAKVNGEDYDMAKGIDVKLDEKGNATVKVVVTANKASSKSRAFSSDTEESTEYTFSIRWQGTDSSLKELAISTSNIFGEELLAMSPDFSGEKTDYTVNVKETNKSFYNVWPELNDENGSLKIYAEENVASDDINADGSIKLASSIEGNDRYAVYPADKTKDTKIRIEVTSETGEQVTDYTVTFAKEKSGSQGGGQTSGDSGNGTQSGDADENTGGDASKGDMSKTGDSSDMTLWLFTLILAAVTGMTAAFRREKGE